MKTQRPLAQRFGGAFFCELPFYVNRHVLIPRFDTELLVEEVIKNSKAGSSVLDLCTGSGCIAVVLAKHDFLVTASDISRKALRVARRNARLHNASIKFVRSNLFENIKQKFDVIVSNPPYIKTSEIGKHDKSILFEPRIALDGGADGLKFYREIIKNSRGHLFLEIGHELENDVKKLLHEGGFRDIKVVKDKQGLSRVVHGIF